MGGKLLLLTDNVIHTSDRNLSAQTVASVVITGIVVVFLGLIILIALVWLYGKIFDIINKKKSEKAKASIEAAAAEAAPKIVTPPPAPVPAVESGIEEEVAAVIAAAVAAYGAQTGKKLAVRSIKRAADSSGSGSRSAWSAAGLYENTRPF